MNNQAATFTDNMPEVESGHEDRCRRGVRLQRAVLRDRPRGGP
jgi:hypothetical protein